MLDENIVSNLKKRPEGKIVKECRVDEDYMSTYSYVKELFKDDVDKGGHPYIGHLERVANKCKDVSKDAMIIGLLHDVIEDKGVTPKDLQDKGYNLNIVKGVALLTKTEFETYSNYIDVLVNNGSIDALYVKKADLEDNMNLSRLKEVTERDINRLEKRYIPTWKKVVKRIKEIEEGVL